MIKLRIDTTVEAGLVDIAVDLIKQLTWLIQNGTSHPLKKMPYTQQATQETQKDTIHEEVEKNSTVSNICRSMLLSSEFEVLILQTTSND